MAIYGLAPVLFKQNKLPSAFIITINRDFYYRVLKISRQVCRLQARLNFQLSKTRLYHKWHWTSTNDRRIQYRIEVVDRTSCPKAKTFLWALCDLTHYSPSWIRSNFHRICEYFNFQFINLNKILNPIIKYKPIKFPNEIIWWTFLIVKCALVQNVL